MSDAAEASHSAWRQIEHRWDKTQEQWHDTVADDFLRRFWEPLQQEVSDYLRALDELVEALESARAVADD